MLHQRACRFLVQLRAASLIRKQIDLLRFHLEILLAPSAYEEATIAISVHQSRMSSY